MRVFLDSNVLVSAFIARGLCADVFRLTVAEHDPIVGRVVLDEVRRILRTKFESNAAAMQLFEEAMIGIPVVPKPRAILATPVVRDPADAWVLASAVAGQADVLVTGDADLLVLASEAPVLILAPRTFWERCRAP